MPRTYAGAFNTFNEPCKAHLRSTTVNHRPARQTLVEPKVFDWSLGEALR
jgi:hypothetical protein